MPQGRTGVDADERMRKRSPNVLVTMSDLVAAERPRRRGRSAARTSRCRNVMANSTSSIRARSCGSGVDRAEIDPCVLELPEPGRRHAAVGHRHRDRVVRDSSSGRVSSVACSDAPALTSKSCQSSRPLKYSPAVSTVSPVAECAPPARSRTPSAREPTPVARAGSVKRVSTHDSHTCPAMITSATSAGAIGQRRRQCRPTRRWRTQRRAERLYSFRPSGTRAPIRATNARLSGSSCCRSASPGARHGIRRRARRRRNCARAPAAPARGGDVVRRPRQSEAARAPSSADAPARIRRAFREVWCGRRRPGRRPWPGQRARLARTA